jgi:hypothetical protein
MSEAMGDRAEMERRLIERSLEDDAFRQRLVEDPKATMEQELGVRLPEGVQVIAVEETAGTIYLVLPSTSQVGEGEELSDQELSAVAGGAPGPTASGDTCSTAACGGFTCLDDLDCG